MPVGTHSPWPRPVVAGLALLLGLLAAATAARGAGAWAGGRATGRPVPPLHDAPGARSAVPLVPPDPTRLVVDLALPGAAAPRPLGLPRGARLGDLLAAAGLPEGLAVDGARGPDRPLPPGRRLAVGADGRARLEAMPAARRVRLGLPLDLNADDAAALALLPGIGPARAAAIVADRTRRGPFASPRALGRVHGIGPATVARLVGRVTAGRAGRP